MKVWKKSLLMFLALILLIVGTVVVYAGTIWNTTRSSLKETYTNLGNKNTNIETDKPLTILLMGVDTGDASRGGSNEWAGNSDSMIVLTLNPKTNTSTMVSMERDTMTNILDSKGNIASQQKMNAAYPSGYNSKGINGAASWAMKTVGQQAGINVDNFVAINMDGLISLVNDVGGIDVNNDSGGDIYIYNTEPEYTAVVPPGKQHVNGEQALVFARDRDTLSNGDYGRTAHQREVITQLMKKMLNMNNISQYQKFLNDVSDDFKTNVAINSSNIQSLLAYKDCFKKVVSIQYQGVGEIVGDGSYQFTPNQTLLAVQNAMLKSLGRSTITDIDDNIVTYDNYFGTMPDDYYLPSATVSKGNKSTTYGISPNGNFVKITSKNAGKYVSTNGESVSVDGKSNTSSSSVNDSYSSDDDYLQ